MIIPVQGETPELLATPAHACEGVRSALNVIHGDIEKMGGPSGDPNNDATYSTIIGNEIARTCGSLCTSGCVRDMYNRAETAGLVLPPSQQQERLFELVSLTLASAVVEEAEQAPQKVVEIEVPAVTAEELKETIMRRINIVQEPELIDKMVALHNKKYPDDPQTAEDYQEALQEYITPIKDDETWEALADFCKGNIRLAQMVMAYFQSVFPYFRSSRPKDQAQAASITEPFIVRDGSYRKVLPGFKPANPYEISSLDIETVVSMVDEDGILELPQGYGAYSAMKVKEDEPAEEVNY